MTQRNPQGQDSSKVSDEYQAPEVESHLEEEEIEREVAYAGQTVEATESLLDGGQ